MLINLTYDCDYVPNMILRVISMIICVFEFLSVYRRKNLFDFLLFNLIKGRRSDKN